MYVCMHIYTSYVYYMYYTHTHTHIYDMYIICIFYHR